MMHGDPGRALTNVLLLVVIVLSLGQASASHAAVPAAPPDQRGEIQTGVTHHASLAAALEASRQDQQLVLLIFGAAWCPPCQALKDKVLNHPAFQDHVGPIHMIQIDVDLAPEQARRFEVNAIPQLVLMTGDQIIMDHREGYMASDELTTWIDDVRQQQQRGLWYGADSHTTQSLDLPEPDDAPAWTNMIEMLGHPDPPQRARIAAKLVQNGKSTLPHLIRQADHDLLAVRIGVAETLRTMAPEAPLVDPWATPSLRKQQQRELDAWWAANPDLKADDQQTLTPAQRRILLQALRNVRSEDPLNRTRGMTRLMEAGRPILPELHDSMNLALAQEDAPTNLALDMVRWAILIPPDLEQRVHARVVLARGTSEERQQAATRLGQAGAPALEALRELINDADPLVRESVAHALTQVGGDNAMAAMAVLLDAHNANLRMVAAQQLGQTKSLAAGDYLIKVLDDEDELVVTTAIAALVEIKAEDRHEALIQCLQDKRWRVRAAAAEALGTLEIAEGTQALQATLHDPDAFVVSTTLESLQKLEALPAGDLLLQVASAHPDTIASIANKIIESDAIDTAVIMYDQLPFARQPLINAVIEQAGHSGGGEDQWTALLQRMSETDEPALRRLFAKALFARPVSQTLPHIHDLLQTTDQELRSLAGLLLLRVVAYHMGVAQDGTYSINFFNEHQPDFGILNTIEQSHAMGNSSSNEEAAPPDDDATSPPVSPDAIRDYYRQWHESLDRVWDAAAMDQPMLFLAWYVTGDGEQGLSVLTRLLKSSPWHELLKDDQHNWVVGAVFMKLPWPQGRAALEAAMDQPDLYSRLLNICLKDAVTHLRDDLLVPERIDNALAQSKEENLNRIVTVLLNADDDGNGLLVYPHFVPLLEHLLKSDLGIARAIALHALSRHQSLLEVELVKQGLHDPDPWVRWAAMACLDNLGLNIPEKEQLLGHLIDDKNDQVAQRAITALLQPEIAATIDQYLNIHEFRYDELTVFLHWPMYAYSRTLRPAMVIADRTPPFLDQARRKLHALSTDPTNDDLRDVLVALLCQYGDFAALASMRDRWARQSDQSPSPVLKLGLLLAKDESYLPVVQYYIDKSESSYALREMLTLLQSMPGTSARQMRRDINRAMRTME